MVMFQPNVGDGEAFDPILKATGIICQADKTKSAGEMRFDSAIKHIDVFRRIECAPLHTYNDTLLRHFRFLPLACMSA
jgi:hypothetical protein